MRTEPSDLYLSTAQACAKLGGISRWTLMGLIRSGDITAIKGPAKNSHLHVPEESVNAYMARQTIGGHQSAGAA
jgi:predicted site-specific integrase-resolvase